MTSRDPKEICANCKHFLQKEGLYFLHTWAQWSTFPLCFIAPFLWANQKKEKSIGRDQPNRPILEVSLDCNQQTQKMSYLALGIRDDEDNSYRKILSLKKPAQTVALIMQIA